MIFISYRRDDSSGHAGRLRDRLRAEFGPESIFTDVDSIPWGQDFVEAVKEAIGRSQVLLVVIGRGWVSPRLNEPDDVVRLEITLALERRIPIIPILVQDAEMPSRKELPPEVAPIAHRNAIEASDIRWDYDTGRIIEAVRTLSGSARSVVSPSTPAARHVVSWLVGQRRRIAVAVAVTLPFGGAVAGMYLTSPKITSETPPPRPPIVETPKADPPAASAPAVETTKPPRRPPANAAAPRTSAADQTKRGMDVLAVVDSIKKTPDVGSSAWNRNIKSILLSAYDLRERGILDTPEAVNLVPCEVFRAINDEIARRLFTHLYYRYGFMPDGDAHYAGDELGFSEAMKPTTVKRMKECGLLPWLADTSRFVATVGA